VRLLRHSRRPPDPIEGAGEGIGAPERVQKVLGGISHKSAPDPVAEPQSGEDEEIGGAAYRVGERLLEDRHVRGNQKRPADPGVVDRQAERTASVELHVLAVEMQVVGTPPDRAERGRGGFRHEGWKRAGLGG
jgi:hypothetical protein